MDGGAVGGSAIAGRGVECSRPAADGLAGVRGLWSATTQQRLRRAGAENAVWEDPLAPTSGAVCERLCGLAEGAVGSGVGVGGAPTHRCRGAVDGVSVGGVYAV